MTEPATLGVIPGAALAQLRRVADGLVVGIAASLPWSTSATSILVVVWLLATLPTLDLAAIRRVLLTPAGGLPAALVLLAVMGLVWADVPWAERFDGLGAFAKLAVLPLLIAQFYRSDQGRWVLVGFVASATLLLALSWAFVLRVPFDPGMFWTAKQPGIPVKDYISQSGIFTICAFALLDHAFLAWRERRDIRAMVGGVLLALLFLLNIFFVATSRTTVMVIPILLVLFGFIRLGRKQLIGVMLIGVVSGVVIWETSPYLRQRVTHLFVEVEEYRDPTAETSAGYRIGFWAMSLRALGEAPVIGHGTGSIGEVFRGQGSETAVNPHNQVFAVGIQLGVIGVLTLIAMWVSHWRLFLDVSAAGWFGLVVVTQNVVSSLFNSHLSDFTQGWIYVVGVGVAAGMIMQARLFNTDRGVGR